MMKLPNRFRLWMRVLLLIIGSLLLFMLFKDEPNNTRTLPATINRDCAPWDGAAFTIKIPLDDENIIDISIWKSPDIKLLTAFSFPDETGQVGNVLLMHRSGLPDRLSGKIFLMQVDPNLPVEGQFDLQDGNGTHFKWKFKAEWKHPMILCG